MSYRQWFNELDQQLTQHRELWQLRHFALQQIPWQTQWPDLADAISTLTLPQVHHLAEYPEELYQTLAEYFPAARHLHPLDQVSDVPILQQARSAERWA